MVLFGTSLLATAIATAAVAVVVTLVVVVVNLGASSVLYQSLMLLLVR